MKRFGGYIWAVIILCALIDEGIRLYHHRDLRTWIVLAIVCYLILSITIGMLLRLWGKYVLRKRKAQP
jgi:hypothetical protein